MRMNVFTRLFCSRQSIGTKLLYWGICVCIFVSIGLAVVLLTQVDDALFGRLRKLSSRHDRNSNVSHEYRLYAHPKNIFPVLQRQQTHLRINKIHTSNRTISNISTKAVGPVIMSVKPDKGTNSIEGERLFKNVTAVKPSYNVHTFYYPWYGNPDNDGDYYHWNHQYIQHWKPAEAKKWPSGRHTPPDDVGANFYPSLGAYSSRDPAVVDKHMQMILFARIGVVVVSWYPPGDADNEGRQPDDLMPMILDAAHKYDLKVAVHIEPYKNRDQRNMKINIQYLVRTYGDHPAFYRRDHGAKKNLPLFYIYDSYQVSSQKWKELLTPGSSASVRGTDYDGIFIGLVVDQTHTRDLLQAGFDGFYTYFATNQFTYGSSWQNWKSLSKFAKLEKLLFIPSVGPGYIDTAVRPWNGANTRLRVGGKYYDQAFSNAFAASPDVISITSFNEWHEGTQIEPAVKKNGKQYFDYGVKGENFYLNLTRDWVSMFEEYVTYCAHKKAMPIVKDSGKYLQSKLFDCK